jgi:hypothetical protein
MEQVLLKMRHLASFLEPQGEHVQLVEILRLCVPMRAYVSALQRTVLIALSPLTNPFTDFPVQSLIGQYKEKSEFKFP